MNRYCRVLFLGSFLSVMACSGCYTTRSATNEANIMAARDLTFHGMNALHHGQADQAENFLKQASDACPDDQRIRQHLANAMVQQGKVDNAIEQLETAIEQSHQDPRLYVELGNLYLRKQDHAKALECATIALQINRQNPCAWLLRGKCEEAQGDDRSALASYLRASSFEEADPQSQLLIAGIYRKMGRPLQALNALDVYNETFATDQIPLEAVLLTAETLIDLNQHQRATDQLVFATRRADATPETWLALSRVQSLSGNSDAAMMTVQNATTLFPDDVNVRAWTTALAQQSAEGVPVTHTASAPRSIGY